MKRFFALLLIIPAGLFAQQKGFVVTGSLKGLPEGSEVTLSDANNVQDTLARAVVTKNQFVLKGTVQEPNVFFLNLHGPQKKSFVFIGNENVTLSGDVAEMTNLQVKGSSIHDDYSNYAKQFNPLFEQLGALTQKINGTPNIQPGDSLLLQHQALIDLIIGKIDSYVDAHNASPVAPFLMVVTAQLDQDMASTERRFAKLKPAAQEGFYGKIIKERIDKSKIGQIGSQALEFTQADVDGKDVALSSFRGKYVLVDFWASWCKPCRMENPNVVENYNEFKGKNFTVLGVSLDREKESWLAAIKEDKLDWTHVSDLQFWNNAVARLYGIEGIPANLLIDPNGKVVARNLRGEGLKAKLRELLGSN
ncbi:TlpA disulfide reductase family protein [Pseudobacter ginsenosidimutans]|uniref:Peroxiredoxin n=1 Tax=Pseudobacter ginsenosidimutans TaxID=661488 RepID=A0A4Q7MI00_9BACT|nr:TlpA disulfide reductase family protein [Pseudobacter ginsenosidimutans]RZS66878.1 peroxiredoxin [Pseudobacter ginsenosidimutans]